MADLTITAASVLYTSGGSRPTGIAGATITAGQAVYVDTANSNVLKLAQCDGTVLEATVEGIALNGGGIGQPVSYATTGATINIGATTAKTTTYLLSATAGGVAPQADITSGQRIVRLGHASATDGTFIVDIRNVGAVV
jgi:hypothetical protein